MLFVVPLHCPMGMLWPLLRACLRPDWEDSDFSKNMYPIYIYRLAFVNCKKSVSHLLQGDQARHHQARLTAEQSQQIHTGLWKSSAEVAQCLCCPRPTFHSCFTHREIMSTRCRQLSGACSPAHAFAIALLAAAAGGVDSYSEAHRQCPFPPNSFLFVNFAFFFLFSCFLCHWPSFCHVLDKAQVPQKRFQSAKHRVNR